MVGQNSPHIYKNNWAMVLGSWLDLQVYNLRISVYAKYLNNLTLHWVDGGDVLYILNLILVTILRVYIKTMLIIFGWGQFLNYVLWTLWPSTLRLLYFFCGKTYFNLYMIHVFHIFSILLMSICNDYLYTWLTNDTFVYFTDGWEPAPAQLQPLAVKTCEWTYCPLFFERYGVGLYRVSCQRPGAVAKNTPKSRRLVINGDILIRDVTHKHT